MEGPAIVIQARMASTRLPGKVLMDFCGRPMLLFQIELLKSYRMGIPILVATGVSVKDDAINNMCLSNDIQCFRGSDDNVFLRYRVLAEENAFDNIVRLTADNPLTNYTIFNLCIEEQIRSESDLTTTRKIMSDGSIERYVAKGNSVDVISSKALLGVDTETLSEREKEHVIPVFFKGQHKISFVRSGQDDRSSYSVDEPEDFYRVEKYVGQLLREKTLLKEMGYE